MLSGLKIRLLLIVKRNLNIGNVLIFYGSYGETGEIVSYCELIGVKDLKRLSVAAKFLYLRKK